MLPETLKRGIVCTIVLELWAWNVRVEFWNHESHENLGPQNISKPLEIEIFNNSQWNSIQGPTVAHHQDYSLSSTVILLHCLCTQTTSNYHCDLDFLDNLAASCRFLFFLYSALSASPRFNHPDPYTLQHLPSSWRIVPSFFNSAGDLCGASLMEENPSLDFRNHHLLTKSCWVAKLG